MNALSIAESLAIKSDSTGRPEVSSASCEASVGRVRVKFHGGARLETLVISMDVLLNVIPSTLNTALNTLFLVIIPVGCTISSQSTLRKL